MRTLKECLIDDFPHFHHIADDPSVHEYLDCEVRQRTMASFWKHWYPKCDALYEVDEERQTVFAVHTHKNGNARVKPAPADAIKTRQEFHTDRLIMKRRKQKENAQ